MANNDLIGNNVLLTGGLADGVQIGTRMPATGIFSSLIATGRTWLSQYTVLGGELNVTMGEGILPTAMGIADSTYDFGRPLTVGDYLIIRSIYQTPYEYVQIGALVSGTIYNITRGLGTGGAAAAWPANSVYILLGASGDGRIIMTANGAPRLMVIEQGVNADDAEPRVIVGLLDGITDPVFGALTGWGLWGDKVYITGALNATSGVISGELAMGAAGSIKVDTDAVVIDADGISLNTISGGASTVPFLHLNIKDGGVLYGNSNIYSSWGGGAGDIAVTWILTNRVAASPWAKNHIILDAVDSVLGQETRIDVNAQTQVVALGTGGGLTIAFNVVTGDITTTGVYNAPLKTPANGHDTGAQGDICWDADYIYVCTAADTWSRTPITHW